MKKRNGSGSRRLVEMTSKFQASQHLLLKTLHGKGMIGAADLKRMTSAVDRAVAQKRSSDVFSTSVAIHARVVHALETSIEDQPEQREAKEIDVLAAVSTMIETIADPRELFRVALARLQQDIPFENGTFLLLDPEEDRLETVALIGAPVDLIDGVEFDMGAGLSAWVAKKKRPVLIPELARVGKPGGPVIRSFLSMPLVVQGDMIGVVNLSHSQARAFDEDDLRLVKLVGGMLASPLSRLIQRRESRRHAVTDRLTGLYNRRHFRERVTAELARAERRYQPVSLVVVDVDGFGDFNERFGHAAGDRVLLEISKVLQRTGRKSDLIARYAGGQFAVLMPAADDAGAAAAAERFRRDIESHVFPQKRKVTVSLGAASYPEAGGELELIAKAEQALFLAKKNGRNRALSYNALAVH